MCGITGILNLNKEPVSPVVLRKMTDAIAHRGPDGEGFYIDKFLGFGHRRLAIIDLTPAGNQPMSTTNGRYIITYNGEIYNFRELRIQLQSLGHTFVSKTDSEVILHAYSEWREKCLEKFNGMFAFAIWDKQNQELFLARDRYGIKPLYYTFAENKFIFASEQKAILQHFSYKKEIDKEALLEYFTFQNIFTEKTLLKDINLFPAGHWTKVQLESISQLNLVQYWDYNFQEPENIKSENEYVEELSVLFQQAVKRQLISDVDIGCYLSGGIDSGSITAVAAAELPYMRTFTCGFDLTSASGIELAFDEREKAEYMSYLFKTEHYEVVLKSGDMERILPKLAWHLEEPRIGQSYPNFYASGLASKFVKVVLSGAGGDELFAGYPWRYYKAAINDNFEDYIDKYYNFWQRLIPNTQIQQVFSPIWDEVSHIKTRDIFKNVFKKHTHSLKNREDYINHSLYFEAKTFLHGLLLIEDKISMAHGLETRVPFLDNDLVDFAMKLPVKFKLKNFTETIRLNENELSKTNKYFQQTHDGKLLLRKVMEKYIPQKITEAKKQGFSSPDASWFKGESIDYVKHTLFNNQSKIYDYLDEKTVLSLVNEHLDGKQNRRLLIWSLLNFEWWLKNYID
jgi:asparagine synthase (glutamine-hydrolysing)